jgi:hypothetical protein
MSNQIENQKKPEKFAFCQCIGKEMNVFWGGDYFKKINK